MKVISKTVEDKDDVQLTISVNIGNQSIDLLDDACNVVLSLYNEDEIKEFQGILLEMYDNLKSNKE